MASWTTLTNTALGAYKILRAATMQALYDNPQAIAERATNAPVVQVPVIEVKTSGTSASWTWPDGVTAATFWLQAAGGGARGGSGNGAKGGDTSITYNSVTTTAEGGDGGEVGYSGRGGNAGGGDFSVDGETSFSEQGGGSFFGVGARYLSGVAYGLAKNGGGGTSATVGGCGGEMVRKRIVKVDGLNTVTYTVGTGGAAGSGTGTPTAGADGVIIIEY